MSVRRTSFASRMLKNASEHLKNRKSECLHHQHSNIQFSDMQLTERGPSSSSDQQDAMVMGGSEEIILRPKLLKQQNTESPPLTPSAAGILKNGKVITDNLELPNADGKFNDQTPPNSGMGPHVQLTCEL